MLTGQPPNLPIIGRRVNAERQSLKLRAEIISLAAAFHCAFVKHLETGLLHLGALCLDIIIHNLERSERATKLRRKIGCSALDQLDAMLTHHRTAPQARSEEHTSELQSLMRISYAVFCLKKKNNKHHI